MTVETKTIDGVIHRPCKDCGAWTPKVPKYCRCKDCQKIKNKAMNAIMRERQKQGKYQYKQIVSEYMSPEVIKRQLRGGNIRDLYADCEDYQIEAMETCNVNLLLRGR